MMVHRIARWGALVLGACVGAFVGLLLHSSVQWIGSTFPGFFILENRIVPSISLPDWGIGPEVFQTELVAVDTKPIESSVEVYALVSSNPPGTLFEYRLRRADGSEFSRAIASRVFTYTDYFFLFGSILLSGTVFLLAGLVVCGMKPHLPASRGLLSAGTWAGLFALTALDLYWPHHWFRLHVLAESLLPAGFIHFALVFPTDRIAGRRWQCLTAVYAPFLLLAAVYQAQLFDPVSYSSNHLLAVAAGGLSGVPLLATISYDLLTNSSVLVRRRLGVVALGALAGFVLPTILWVASSMLGGTVPVNAAGLTAFLFPLSLAYGIVKQDLFEVDLMLRRAMVYASLVTVIALAYFGVLFGVGIMMPGAKASTWSPIALAVLNFALLFLLAPLHERLQKTIDIVFFRKAYEIETNLSELSSALAVPHTVEGVLEQLRVTCDATVCPQLIEMHLQADAKQIQAKADAGRQPVTLPPETAARLERGKLVTSYEFEEGGPATLHLWNVLSAELLIPLHHRGRMMGIAVFGPRRSGHPYSSHDLVFLQAALNQVALALATADAFTQLDALNRNLEQLNENLEQQVRDRTAQLNASNSELNASVTRLREAYAQLEQSQASLLRADRLATLGQLTAGIAHEMNTPLSAVLNALRIIGELGAEYRDSIDDPQVLPEDHRAVAAEIVNTAEAASRWASKAAGYIRSVKTHGREYQHHGASTRFPLRAVIDDTRALLAHRMRTSGCVIEADDSTDGVVIDGDPGILNQVILNLVTNAIDAYEDTPKRHGRVEISSTREPDAIRINVRDFAGGIPADVLPRIFDELYTTKGPGRGTGLGLWITRNLVEQRFAGTLGVDTKVGEGSCFTLRLPVNKDRQSAATSQPLVVAAA